MARARRWRRRQRGGGVGSGSAAAAVAAVAAVAASLVAEAAAWQKRDFGSIGSALGSVAETRHWRQQRGVGGGGSSGGTGGSAAGSAVAVGEGRDVLAMYSKYFSPFFSVSLQISYVEYYVFT